MKSGKRQLIISLIMCALALVIMLLALKFGQKQTQAAFVPPEFEKKAEIGVPEVPENLGWAELDAKAFRVSVCGAVVPTGSSIEVWLTNPMGNDVWLKLRILDLDGRILGETGLITPGQYIKAVSLEKIPAAGTPVILKIMAYEPDTYHSAGSISINTHIQ